MKNTQSADFCADQIDFIMNFAVITNVVIKMVQCISLSFFKINIVFELLWDCLGRVKLVLEQNFIGLM